MRRVLATGLLLLNLTSFTTAQKTVVPIATLTYVESGGSATIDEGSLIGGVENGQWLDAKTTNAKLKGDEKYRLFEYLKGKKGEYRLGAIHSESKVCSNEYFFTPKLSVAAELALGANASWEVLPRRPKKASKTNAAYKKAVADVLRRHGLSKSPVRIEEVFLVDLDGDGRDESVIAASHYVGDGGEGEVKPGSYTLLIVRKTTRGKTQTLLAGGDFVTRKSGGYDGDYTLAGVADLNGDGKLEMIVKVEGYEEHWMNFYQLKDGKITEIKALSYYCGLGRLTR